MNYDHATNESLLLGCLTVDELATLSVPEIRLLEALRYEPMPDKLVYLDDDLRVLNLDHEVALAVEGEQLIKDAVKPKTVDNKAMGDPTSKPDHKKDRRQRKSQSAEQLPLLKT